MEIRTKVADLKSAIENVSGQIDLFIEDGITDIVGGFSEESYNQLVELIADKEENSITLHYPDGMIFASLYDVPPAIKQIVFPHSIISIDYNNYADYCYNTDDIQNSKPNVFKFSSIVKDCIEELECEGYVNIYDFYETDKPQFPPGKYKLEIYSSAAQTFTLYDVSDCDKNELYEDGELNTEAVYDLGVIFGTMAFSTECNSYYDRKTSTRVYKAASEIELTYNDKKIILIMDDDILMLTNGCGVLRMYKTEHYDIPDKPYILYQEGLKHMTMKSQKTFDNGFNFSDVIVRFFDGCFEMEFVDGDTDYDGRYDYAEFKEYW